jgi:hypothetical protein
MLEVFGEVLMQLTVAGATALVTMAARHLWRLISVHWPRPRRRDRFPDAMPCPHGGKPDER